MPVRLSRSQQKEADRVGGIELMLPWPAAITPPAPSRGEMDEATPDERLAAMEMVREGCEAAGLVPVHVRIARVRMTERGTPAGAVYRGGAVRPYLAVIIIGRRWVHATGPQARRPLRLWAAQE